MKFSLILMLAIVCSMQPTTADSLRYASDEELRDELERRTGDIARTSLRLAKLGERSFRARKELDQAQQDGIAADSLAIARAGAFYKLSRQGGSFRYLLQAKSALDFLSRLATLKRLLLDSLESRRQAGLRIAAAEKRIASIREEKRAAEKMHLMLKEALAELQSEQARRNGRQGPRHLSPALYRDGL